MIFTRASVVNSAKARWVDEPWPAEACVSAPGCAGEREQILDRFRGQRRMDDQQERGLHDERDGGEIFHGVVSRGSHRPPARS